MTHHPTYILHLTRHWLRWVGVQGGALPQVTDSGTLDGPPETTLEQMAARLSDPRSRVVLYDGRPIYYTFSLSLPAEALKQQDKILRLKLMQEIGLGEDAVFWAARTEPGAGTPGQTGIFMVVARREAMKDIVAWRDRHRLRNLWVGADLTAIRALLGQSAGNPMVVNADAKGATLYHSNSNRQILKERSDPNAALKPEPANWGGVTGRIHFGGENPPGLLERLPELGALAPLTAGQLQSGTGPVRLAGLPANLLGFDAVLLGGILDHALGHPPAGDMLRELTPPPLELFLQKFTMGRLGAAAGLTVLVLALSGYMVFSSRAASRKSLAAEAQAIEPQLRQFSLQETILRSIKTGRKPALPIFVAIQKAVPQGVTLKSLSVGEKGAIQIVGQAQQPNAPNDFCRGLAASALLEDVKMPTITPDAQGRMVSFQINCHAKGRGK